MRGGGAQGGEEEEGGGQSEPGRADGGAAVRKEKSAHYVSSIRGGFQSVLRKIVTRLGDDKAIGEEFGLAGGLWRLGHGWAHGTGLWVG